ncbi:DUF6350 family protein [Corynebacterium sp. TAE3-ERU30]|uniref:cell division protein PerM n=1 Tax=Corynebacterium sp. TAE3-ERU30 TaxID=2849496 RepID=UPI001C4507F1|nr:hypothetical protein [Corynebacterium sp. TAE3-ERU30]
MTWRSRLLRFGGASVIANVIVLALCVVVAFAAILFSNEPLGYLLNATAYVWAGAHTAALHTETVTFSAMPLLGPVVVIAGMAALIRHNVNKKVSVVDIAYLTGATVLVPLLFAVAIWAVLRPAEFTLQLPNLLGRVLAIHLLALIFGMGPRLWRALCKKYGVPSEVLSGFDAATRFHTAMAAVAVLVVGVSIAAHHAALGEIRSAFEGSSGFLGVVGVSVLYAVNGVVAAMAVLSGSEARFGEGFVSLFDATLVPMPPLPLLTAWPASIWDYAWLLLLVPMLIALEIGWRIPARAERPWLCVALSALWTAAIAAVLAWLLSGQVGLYGSIGVHVPLFAGVSAAWMLVLGIAMVGLDRLLAYRAAAAVPEEFRETDSEEEYSEDSEETEEYEADFVGGFDDVEHNEDYEEQLTDIPAIDEHAASPAEESAEPNEEEDSGEEEEPTESAAAEETAPAEEHPQDPDPAAGEDDAEMASTSESTESADENNQTGVEEAETERSQGEEDSSEPR